MANYTPLYIYVSLGWQKDWVTQTANQKLYKNDENLEN